MGEAPASPAAMHWLLACETAARAAIEANACAARSDAAREWERHVHGRPPGQHPPSLAPDRAHGLTTPLGRAQLAIREAADYVAAKHRAGYVQGTPAHMRGVRAMAPPPAEARTGTGTVLPIGNPELDRTLHMDRLRNKLSALHRSMAMAAEAADSQHSSLGTAKAELAAAKLSLAAVGRT